MRLYGSGGAHRPRKQREAGVGVLVLVAVPRPMVFVLYAKIEASTKVPGHPELVETVTVGGGKKLYVCH